MPSTQTPMVITDAPARILALAIHERDIVINLRPDYWRKEVLERLKVDTVWKITIQLNNGLYMSPEYTDFLCTVKKSDAILSSVQETDGSIVMVAGKVSEIFWLSHCVRPPHGVHAAIRLEKENYRFGYQQGQLWGSYVLAVCKLQANARPTSRKDPQGKQFIEYFKKYRRKT